MTRFLPVFLALSVTVPVAAQKVQFVHAGAYTSLDRVDVYRNGERWLDDFKYLTATAFEGWPASARVELVWPDAPDGSQPFFSETFRFQPNDAVALIIYGDPANRPGHPPLEIRRVDDAMIIPPYPTQAFYRTVPLAVFGPWRPYLRSLYFQDQPPSIAYDQTFNAAPPFMHEIDNRGPDGTILDYSMTDWSDVFNVTILQTATGFLDPPTEDALPGVTISVISDGRVIVNPGNFARVQFVQNSAFVEAERVDIRITHSDSLGPDQVRYEARNLAFRTATPFVDLPSGLTDSGERRTAPDLVVEIFPAGEPEPFFTTTIHLIFQDTYVAMLSGDPLGRPGNPPMQLSLRGGWTTSDSRPDTTSFDFLNGVGDAGPLNLYLPENRARPLAGFVQSGEGAQVFGFPARADTLFLARAEGQREVGSFAVDLTTSVDSTLLLVASGFLNPPSGIAAYNSDFGLFAVHPGGGRFQPLPLFEPPGFWTSWWFWLIALTSTAVLGLGFNQARVLRLRARERELSLLVDERTSQLREEKRKTEEQARRLSELDEAKNRFFANISHEFRTPLTLILGPVQDGLDATQHDVVPFGRRQVEVMRRSARRLLRLINQLLDLSRLESGKMELSPRLDDLADFASDLGRSFVPLAERGGIDLTTSVPNEVVACRFDTDAMEKVISNLLSNAIKFTPSGGKVLLDMEADERQIRLSVRDTGPGIAPEDLGRVFERFQQVDTSIRRKFEGSGIGLTLAKELVELHGGRIDVESKVGYGTVFTVTLPRSDEPILSRPEGDGHVTDAALLEEALLVRPVADVEAEADDAAGATVLVVEDNDDVRDYLRQHLSERYRVLEAHDGEEGLERARSEKPELILSDVMMPRMDGYELCRRIKTDETLRHTPVILLTAKAGEADTIEGLETGADAYVPKPFSVPELKLRIANLVASRRMMREQFSREVLVRPSGVAITSDEESLLNDVLERINTHLGDSNYSIDWLADDLGMSRRQLERRVVEMTKLSPAQLVRRLRLERAAQLLRAHVGTVSEVAFAVGFKSPSHFSAVFKQAYGESPNVHGRGVD